MARPGRSWVACLIAVVAAAGCRDRRRDVVEVDLPGLSIGLPGKEIDRFQGTEYHYGWVRGEDTFHSVFTTVLWREGTVEADLGSPESVAAWLSIFDWDDQVTAKAPDRQFTRKDVDTHSFKVFVGLGKNLATIIPCAGRLIAVLTAGPPRARTDEIHGGTVTRVACKPIADEERTTGKPPPVITRPPEGWQPNPEIDALTTAWSSGSSTLLFTFFYRGHPSLEDTTVMVRDAIGYWGEVEQTGSERVGAIEVWRGVLRHEKDTEQVYAHRITCAGRPVLGVLFGYDDVSDGRDALVAARCE